MGVVVQAMVLAAISGMLFTANPTTGNRDEMLIEAARGLGERIVSGTVLFAGLPVKSAAEGAPVTFVSSGHSACFVTARSCGR